MSRSERFGLRIVGNENESCKHYAKEVLRAKISPMFAAYCKGKLVKTWRLGKKKRPRHERHRKAERFSPSFQEALKGWAQSAMQKVAVFPIVSRQRPGLSWGLGKTWNLRISQSVST